MSIVYVMKQKNNAPRIKATLTLPNDAEGNPGTLEAAKEVLLHMRPKTGGEALIDIVMTITSKSENKVEHQWELDETELAIIYELEFEVIFEEEERNVGIPESGFYELEFTERIKK